MNIFIFFLAQANSSLNIENPDEVVTARNMFLDPESHGLAAILGALVIMLVSTCIFLYFDGKNQAERVWKQSYSLINELRDENHKLSSKLIDNNSILNKFGIVQQSQRDQIQLMMENHKREINDLISNQSQQFMNEIKVLSNTLDIYIKNTKENRHEP